MFKKSNVREFARNSVTAFNKSSAKIATGATALVASGSALATGGGGSPGAAIAGELASGKSDVLLVIAAVAVILGALILWRYVKRAN